MNWTRRRFLSATAAAGLALSGRELLARPERSKLRIVLFAGPASHGYGAHEHPASCKYLTDTLNTWGGVEAVCIEGQWPGLNDPRLKGAKALYVYCDGLSHHPFKSAMADIDKLVEQGVGIGMLHYALIPDKKQDYPHMLDWLGGYYEPHWSVNPHWHATIKQVPDHAITRGVGAFDIQDEWYYHMRFNEGMKGVTPLLTATPPDATRKRKHGPHSGNPHVAARLGKEEHLAWAYENEKGNRGFGFTGLHFHWNLAHDTFRQFLLNAAVWLAGADVPQVGVESPTPTLDELIAYIGDPPGKFNREAVEQRLASFKQSA